MSDPKENGPLHNIGVAAVLSIRTRQEEKRLGFLSRGEGDESMNAYRHAGEMADTARDLLHSLVDSYKEEE